MSTKRILIADDSATMRAMLVAIVETLGDYRIIEAASGFEALRLLPREHVDLVLTDINMPDINGFELIKYLRTNPNYKNIPVFIVSTEGSPKDIEKAKQLGVDEYVVKPFSPEKLQQLIKRYLHQSS
ncbi:MAG: response regulator [Desulfuromonadaceae bacterium]|nr:response regulator [Desulfuromonadaceae bacterium]MDD5105428.1 response regulator [Desulfuromonadaceae bacterium]